ncbi:MAG: hypothetical protein JWN44_1782 [Myxococcales bacterium]|nr:hypothetical protein [Myxococcales bacterium]
MTLARRLAALPAAAMRQATLRAILDQLDADAAARLCADLVRRGPDGAPFDVALLALCAILDARDLGYERHAALYAAARTLANQQLARLLLTAQPPPPGTPQAAELPGGREITLGERKSLARGRRREVLDRLLRDPDETVLTILLANPRITEADVVRLAARRPTTAGAQRTILRCERFIARYAVKRALVFNPYTPTDLAARLIVLLTRPDQQAVAHDASLNEAVREAAQDALARGV